MWCVLGSPVARQRVSWTPRVAVRIAFACNHETVSCDGIAGFGAESRREPSHMRVAMFFATAYTVALNIAFGVVVTDLVRMSRQLLWVCDLGFAPDCTMTCTRQLTGI